MRLLICLLVAMGVEAQPFALPQLGSDDQTGTAPKFPQTIGTMDHWWVSSDMTVGATVSNQWADRIQGLLWQEGDPSKQPTNSALGVRFETSSTILTNSGFDWAPSGAQNTGTVAIVFTYENPPNLPILIASQAAGLMYVDTSSRYNYNFTVQSLALPTFTPIDVIMVTTNGTGTVYTNGVASRTGTIPHNSITRMGNDTTGDFLKGYISQFMNYSNGLSPSAVSNLHNYFVTNSVWPQYVVAQTFDVAGTPAGWASGGTVTFHNTSGPLEGTGDVLVGTGTSFANPAQFGPYNEAWGFCLFKVTTLPSSSANFIGFWDYTTGLTMVGGVQLDNLGKISLVVNGSGGAVMTDAITINTLYYCWIHYKTGTGNAVVSCGISTTGTEPTGGTSFVGTTTGTSTSTAGYYVVETQNSAVSHFDHVRVATTDPGKSPP